MCIYVSLHICSHAYLHSHICIAGWAPHTYTHIGLIMKLPSQSHIYMDAYISHTHMYTCICVHSYVQTHVFVHICTAHSHICMCIYTVLSPLTGRNTHAHVLEQQRDPALPLASILCTKPGVHSLSKWHHKFAVALSSCRSPNFPFGKLFLLWLEYAQEAVPTSHIYTTFLILKGNMKRKYKGQSSPSQYLWVWSTVLGLQNSYWSKERNEENYLWAQKPPRCLFPP